MRTQKTFTQAKQTAANFLLSAPIRQFYKRVFYMGNILFIFVYASIRLMLHDFPFEILEETFFIVRILLAGWCLAGLCIGSFSVLMFVADNNTVIRKLIIQKIIFAYRFCIKSIKAMPDEKFMERKRTVIESLNI